MPRRQLEQVFMPEESIRNDPKRSAEEMVLDIWKHCSLFPAGDVKEITEQPAGEYTQRFTFPVWNTVLQTTFD
ncbi:Hypothetical protein PENO1_031110 [Penicillium occitanis (nom. inval.)]|nr:Hypothetical protein PENO1_031110 [Penicillium occitanis (nom. inval.)]PCH04236.1 hypothetical protein PENOC_034380 [Penicillium occitanis (nom. inval.)]